MEDNLSFIPKKTFVPSVGQGHGFDVLTTSTFLILLVSGLVAGGLYFYRDSIQKQIAAQKQSLERAQADFEISTINGIVNRSDKIEAAQTLLENHKTLLPIFSFLEKNTSSETRYSTFSYVLNEDGDPEITLIGAAKSYGVLGNQIQTIEQHKDVKKAEFSGIRLGDKGQVNFSVKITFDPSLIKF